MTDLAGQTVYVLMDGNDPIEVITAESDKAAFIYAQELSMILERDAYPKRHYSIRIHRRTITKPETST